MDKVSYESYLELVKQQVAVRTGHHVELQKSTKNNGLVMDGLMIVSEGSNVAPMIYLNNIYEVFLEHGIDVVVDKVLEVYEANKEDIPFDVSILTEFSNIKPLIKMKLINYEKNKQLLEEVVHRKELDLAIVFMIVLELLIDRKIKENIDKTEEFITESVGIKEKQEVKEANIYEPFVKEEVLEKPMKSELVSKYPRLTKIFRELEKHNEIIYDREQELASLEKRLVDIKGIFNIKAY